MTPFEEIEEDLDWREAELAILRLLINDKSLKDIEKSVLFRASWALLYAHFEGFCKFALTVYYDALQKMGKPCKDLPFSTQCFALGKQIKTMRKLAAADFLNAIAEFDYKHREKTPSFPEVVTDSNLWPENLERLLIDADINLPSLPFHNRRLETLVRRRNKIADGEKDLIRDFTYYSQFEDSFKVISYELAFAIDSKLHSLAVR